jgi:cysteine desulfurase
MHINNETGAVNPIEEIHSIIKSKSNAILHVDNVQGFGKVKHIEADLISFSAHKIGGFKGIGGLYAKAGVKIRPIIFGGGQEKGFRSGTESIPLIASFAKACEIISKESFDDYCKIQGFNNAMKNELSMLECVHFNSDDSCSPYIMNLRFDNIMGETLLHSLEKYEIYIGLGSACSKGAKPSQTLKAMGLNNKQIKESIRISFSPQNTESEVNKVCDIIKNEVENLRGIKR